MRLIKIIGLTVFVAACSSLAEMRMWTDSDGNRFEAEYIREVFGTVFLKTSDGRKRSIDTKNLSPVDLKYVRTIVPPEVEVSFFRRLRPRERSKYARDDDIITIVTGTVTIKQKSRSPYEGELVADFYMIGEELVTKACVMLGKETSKFFLNEENDREVSFETEVDIRQYREYNNEQRGWNFLGYILVIKDSKGRFVALSSDQDWMDKTKIADLERLKIRDFFDEDCWEVPVPRPKFYTERSLF